MIERNLEVQSIHTHKNSHKKGQHVLKIFAINERRFSIHSKMQREIRRVNFCFHLKKIKNAMAIKKTVL